MFVRRTLMEKGTYFVLALQAPIHVLLKGI